jgi:hypothetical protein
MSARSSKWLTMSAMRLSGSVVARPYFPFVVGAVETGEVYVTKRGISSGTVFALVDATAILFMRRRQDGSVPKVVYIHVNDGIVLRVVRISCTKSSESDGSGYTQLFTG